MYFHRINYWAPAAGTLVASYDAGHGCVQHIAVSPMTQRVVPLKVEIEGCIGRLSMVSCAPTTRQIVATATCGNGLACKIEGVIFDADTGQISRRIALMASGHS